MIRDLKSIPEDMLTSEECALMAHGTTEVEVYYPETSMTSWELADEARHSSIVIGPPQEFTLWEYIGICAGPVIGFLIFYFGIKSL